MKENRRQFNGSYYFKLNQELSGQTEIGSFGDTEPENIVDQAFEGEAYEKSLTPPMGGLMEDIIHQ